MSELRVFAIGPRDVSFGGMRTFLEQAPEVTVVGHSSDLEEALSNAVAATPDVVLSVPTLGGQSTIPRLRAIHARLTAAVIVVIAGGEFDPDLVITLTEAGLGGYVVWNAMSLEMLHHFLTLELDGTALPVSLEATAALLDAVWHAAQPGADVPALTAREHEVLALAAEGLKDRAIAEKLGIEPTTVTTHMRTMWLKTGVKTRSELIVYAVRHGLI